MRDVDAIAEAVRPELETVEAARLELKARTTRAWKRIGTAFATIVAAGLLISLLAGNGALNLPVFYGAGALAVVVGLIGYFVSIAGPTQELKKAFKREVIGSIVRAMEPGMSFTPEAGVPVSDFRRSRLFGTDPDRYGAEDGLRGKIGKTSVHISEVHAEERRKRRDSKGNTTTYYVTIFKGIFVVADFHKHFRCTTRVLPDRAEKLFGGFGKMLQGFRPFTDEKLVYLEDPEFEKEFVVYGNDQIEARYILSTAMLRRILELKREWKTEVRLSFIDSLVFLAIPHREDFFEPDLSRSALSHEQIAGIVRELSVCFDLVDDLNLNTRIWSKS